MNKHRTCPHHADHAAVVLRATLGNLLKDAEILTEKSMDALAESRRAAGIPYIPEECTAIRTAVRDWYVRGLTERLVSGLTDGVDEFGSSE